MSLNYQAGRVKYIRADTHLSFVTEVVNKATDPWRLTREKVIVMGKNVQLDNE